MCGETGCVRCHFKGRNRRRVGVDGIRESSVGDADYAETVHWKHKLGICIMCTRV